MDARELLAAVRTRQGLGSNYRLARELGISDKTVQRWNVGANTPDDVTAARLAELAGLDPDSVVASMHAQRAANDQERSLWERIARRLEGVGVAAALAAARLLEVDALRAQVARLESLGDFGAANSPLRALA